MRISDWSSDVCSSDLLARELTLPTALQANVNTTLLFAEGAMDLAALAQRITAATNIPVHVRPDALLGLDRFLPKLGNAGASSPALAAPTTVALTGDRKSTRLNSSH